MEVKRPQDAHEVVVERQHLVSRDTVARDLEGEVIGVTHFLGDAVAEVTEFDEAVAESGAGGLGGFPDGAALGEVGGGVEAVVEVVRGDDLSGECELEAVEDRILCGLGLDAGGGELRIGHRRFGGDEEETFELADGEVGELAAQEEELFCFFDEDGIADEGGASFPGGCGSGVVRGGDVGRGFPLGLVFNVGDGLIRSIDEGEKAIRPILGGVSVGGAKFRGEDNRRGKEECAQHSAGGGTGRTREGHSGTVVRAGGAPNKKARSGEPRAESATRDYGKR